MALLNMNLSQMAEDHHCSINLAYGSHNTLRIVVQKDKYLETVFINNQDGYKSDGDILVAVQGAIKRINEGIERVDKINSLNEVIKDWCIQNDCNVTLKMNKPGEMEMEVTMNKED